MAITDPNTVLVLGAGVSAPFGLPLGSGLIDTIANKLSRQLSELALEGRSGLLYNSFVPLNSPKLFRQYSYLQPLVFKLNLLGSDLRLQVEPRDADRLLSKEIGNFMKLRDLLRNQTSDSIDDFIVMNRSYSSLVKICIASEFISALYEQKKAEDNYLAIRDIAKRYPLKYGSAESTGSRNWIHRLINLIRLGVIEGKVTPENKVQIVTFNYDTILEYVLQEQFSNTEDGSSLFPDYRDFVEINHVHGKCGDLSKRIEFPSKESCSWADGIRVIRDADMDLTLDVKQARATAKSLLENATEIYCCGFAFAKANTDLLGLKAGPPGQSRKIFYCNYSNDVGLRNAAENFEYQNSITIEKTEVIPQNDIGVADWIGIGTLGELP